MTSFFKKLNTLISAQINDVIRPMTSDTEDGKARRRELAKKEVSSVLEQDVQTLRQRIEEAVAHERKLEAKADKLYSEIAKQDEIANNALAQNKQGEARIALVRLQQAQRELEMVEEMLREHHQVTQELIERVDLLDTVLQKAQREQESEPTVQAEPVKHSIKTRIQVEQTPETDETPSISSAHPLHTPVTSSSPQPQPSEGERPAHQKVADDGIKLGEKIAQQMDSTREKLQELITQHQDEVMQELPELPTVTPIAPTDQAIDDDLARRLARLAKPDDK